MVSAVKGIDIDDTVCLDLVDEGERGLLMRYSLDQRRGDGTRI